MYRRIALAAALLIAPVALAQEQDNHAELIEWVFAPCMEVAAALDVGDLDAERLGLGISRKHIAEIMLASRDAAIRDVSGKMKADATWEDRRALYPTLLKLCLAQFIQE